MLCTQYVHEYTYTARSSIHRVYSNGKTSSSPNTIVINVRYIVNFCTHTTFDAVILQALPTFCIYTIRSTLCVRGMRCATTQRPYFALRRPQSREDYRSWWRARERLFRLGAKKEKKKGPKNYRIYYAVSRSLAITTRSLHGAVQFPHFWGLLLSRFCWLSPVAASSFGNFLSYSFSFFIQGVSSETPYCNCFLIISNFFFLINERKILYARADITCSASANPIQRKLSALVNWCVRKISLT